MKKPFKWSIALSAGLLALSGIYFWPLMTSEKSAALKQAPSITQPIKLETGARTSAPAAGSTPKVASVQINYKRALAESRNYWAFANKILPAAKAGNANAQFYLWKAIDFCDNFYDMYFKYNGKPLTLDEGLQSSAKLNVSMETVQSIFDRCHEFQDHDASELGNATDWLAKATEAGQPAAQATTAEKILVQNVMQSFAQAGAAPIPITTGPQIGNGADPQELMREAVASRDPEALFTVGWAQGFMNQSDSDKKINRLAWMYVACQRGFDCSANADWVRMSCPNCDAGSSGNLMMTIAGDSWTAVQQRAQDISTQLDAGGWSELGLGS